MYAKAATFGVLSFDFGFDRLRCFDVCPIFDVSLLFLFFLCAPALHPYYSAMHASQSALLEAAYKVVICSMWRAPAPPIDTSVS